MGETGAISLIRHGHLSTAVRLPSVIEADTSEVAGPAAAAFGFGQSAVIMQDVLVNRHGGYSFPAGRVYSAGS